MTHSVTDDRPAVVHVITQLELGGAQRNTLFTVQNLDRARFNVSLVCGPGGVLDDEARALDVPVTFCPSLVRPVEPMRDWQALHEVRVAIEQHRRRTRGPLVVHTHSSKAGVLGRVAGRQLGARVVHTVHGFGFHEGQRWPVRRAYQTVERMLRSSTDAMVFVSRRDMQTAEDLDIIARGSGHIIRSGINLSAFRPDGQARRAIRAELGIPEDARVLVSVANFKPQKNPICGLRAFAVVARAEPKARWIFAGDGELRAPFEEEARRLGLMERIHILGWRKDIPAILNAGDVYLLSSDHEGLPRSVLEALSTGLPVAATNSGGTREVVVEGTGRVVPVGDGEGLGRAAVELLQGSLEVRERAAGLLEEFDIHTMVRKQEKLYARLLDARAPVYSGSH